MIQYDIATIGNGIYTSNSGTVYFLNTFSYNPAVFLAPCRADGYSGKTSMESKVNSIGTIYEYVYITISVLISGIHTSYFTIGINDSVDKLIIERESRASWLAIGI